MKLGRLLFRTARRVNDAEILASADPKRIIEHYIRKGLNRRFGRALRRWFR